VKKLKAKYIANLLYLYLTLLEVLGFRACKTSWLSCEVIQGYVDILNAAIFAKELPQFLGFGRIADTSNEKGRVWRPFV
jgi:hypothetical protein